MFPLSLRLSVTLSLSLYFSLSLSFFFICLFLAMSSSRQSPGQPGYDPNLIEVKSKVNEVKVINQVQPVKRV